MAFSKKKNSNSDPGNKKKPAPYPAPTEQVRRATGCCGASVAQNCTCPEGAAHCNCYWCDCL